MYIPLPHGAKSKKTEITSILHANIFKVIKYKKLMGG
jgi:hypothetical protein